MTGNKTGEPRSYADAQALEGVGMVKRNAATPSGETVKRAICDQLGVAGGISQSPRAVRRSPRTRAPGNASPGGRQRAKQIVFSTDLYGSWGAEFAATLGDEGDKQTFLDLYEAMGSSPPSEPVKDGDVVRHSGEDFMVLELTETDRQRLSHARALMVGAPRDDLMVCERVSELVPTGLLSMAEIQSRRRREIALQVGVVSDSPYL